MKTFAKNLTLSLAGLILISIYSCRIPGVKGSGNVITQDRQVSNFTGIDIGGAYEVHLRQGDTEGLKIEADDNLMELIQTEVKNGTLCITSKDPIRKAEKLVLYITFKELDNIEISGAVKLTSKSSISADNLTITASGAAEINVEVDANHLKFVASGGTDATFSGTATKVKTRISGAGELSAYDLETEEFSLTVSGAANAELNVKESLEVRVSGAAEVYYKGDPKVEKSISGAAKVRRI